MLIPKEPGKNTVVAFNGSLGKRFSWNSEYGNYMIIDFHGK